MTGVVKIALVAGAIALAALAFHSWYSGNQAEWEQRVARVQEQARMDSIAGAEHRARADSLQLVAEAAEQRAARRDTVIRLIREEIEALPPEPESCKLFTEPRDRLISECELQAAELREGLQAQSESLDALRRAEIRARSRGDSLSAVLADRPQPRPGWVPEVSVGPFAGFCIDGTACAGVGVQLSWSVEIF